MKSKHFQDNDKVTIDADDVEMVVGIGSSGGRGGVRNGKYAHVGNEDNGRQEVGVLELSSSSSSVTTSPIGRRQSRCRFVGACAMILLLVGVVTYGGMSYSNESVQDFETTVDVGETYQSETKEFQDGDDPELVPEGSMPEVPPLPYQDWLDATVTLSDGKKYEVIEQITHGKGSYTEGLTYADGRLYESIGLNGRSGLLELDPRTGATITQIGMERKYFAEGLTYVNGKLIQLTYTHKIGFIYDTADLTSPVRNFTYTTTTGEGWGMTYDDDRDEIIVSDGSHYLLYWDPNTFLEKRRVPVMRMNGRVAKNINELEYWRGRVVANVWYQDCLLVIHPETGIVEKEYDLSSIWSQQERTANGAEVLNGISVSDQEDILYVTGKQWDRMFKVRLLP